MGKITVTMAVQQYKIDRDVRRAVNACIQSIQEERETMMQGYQTEMFDILLKGALARTG